MNKKWLCGIATFALCFVLIGCGHEHTWVDATCTEPKTCSECGETEGEPLGHTWVEATCAEPKHCSICGETEGEALAHTWVEATCSEAKHCSVCGETEGEPLEHTLSEANYQQAATCEVCGATVGEPLQADFEKYGLTCDTQLNTSYSYTTNCKDKPENTSIGAIIFSDFDIFTSDETHEELEGYEWRTVTATINFDDENAHNYGINILGTVTDYYNIAGFDDSYNDSTDTNTINYNGLDYSIYCGFEELQDDWGESGAIYQLQVFCRVPIGYDGMVLAFYNAANEDNGNYINEVADENSIFFRLK
ncbi:MAG: hypothetical protein ACI4C4_10820 [Lachnospiraceae bacterium]